MRLYRIDEGNVFTEYQAQRFDWEHTEQVIEDWLEQNSRYIVEDGGLLVIGRQVGTNLGTTIDLLGVDREGNVAVVELKRDKTPRDTLAQALEYASFASTLNGDQLEAIYRQYSGEETASLAEEHHAFFGLGDEEAVSFNKDQVLVVVGTEVVQPIRQSAAYLRQKGLRVVCLEFGYFEAKSGERLLSTDTVVGAEPLGGGRIVKPPITEPAFLAACDDGGRAVFEPLLRMAEEEGLPIHWGARQFTVNVDLDGNEVCVCHCHPMASSPGEMPQGVWFYFTDIAKKCEGSEALIEQSRQRLLDTGVFGPGRKRAVKYVIVSRPTPEQVGAILNIVRDLARGASARAG